MPGLPSDPAPVVAGYALLCLVGLLVTRRPRRRIRAWTRLVAVRHGRAAGAAVRAGALAALWIGLSALGLVLVAPTDVPLTPAETVGVALVGVVVAALAPPVGVLGAERE